MCSRLYKAYRPTSGSLETAATDTVKWWRWQWKWCDTEEEPREELEWNHSLTRQMKQINCVDDLILRHLHNTIIT